MNADDVIAELRSLRNSNSSEEHESSKEEDNLKSRKSDKSNHPPLKISPLNMSLSESTLV